MSTLPWLNPNASTRCSALGERILVIDGAMGTMIQRTNWTRPAIAASASPKATTGAYAHDGGHAHGDGCGCDARPGQQRPADADPPDIIRAIHAPTSRPAPTCSRPTPSTRPRCRRPTTASSTWCPNSTESGARLARAACDAAEASDPSTAALRHRRARPDHPHRLDEPRRERPGLPQHHLRRTARGLPRSRRGLIDGGADVLMVETVFDTLNAKAALFAIDELFEARGARLPVMISGTITDRSGRTLSARPPRRSGTRCGTRGRCAIGLNCALGAQGPAPARRHAGPGRRCLRQRHPNAGLPNAFGGYDETPEDMAGDAGRVRPRRPAEPGRRLLRHHAGAHPRDRRGRARRAAARAAAAARTRHERLPRQTRLTGLEPLQITPGNQLRQRRRAHQRHRLGAVQEADPGGPLRRGASWSRASRSRAARRSSTSTWTRACSTPKRRWSRSCNLIAAEPDIARVPVMVDSSKWSVIEAGLKCVQGKGIVNSISMKEGEAAFLRQARLVRRYGAAVVVMAFDEAGPGRHRRAQGRDLLARLPAADRAGRLPARRHHLRPEHLRDRHRHRGAQQLRRRLHRGHARAQAPLPAQPRLRRRVQRVASRSAATTRCARRSTRCSCTTPSTPAWTWASSTPAPCRSTTTSTPDLRERVEDVVLNRRADAHRAPARDRRQATRARRARSASRTCAWREHAGRERLQPRAGARHRPVHRGRHRGGARRCRRARST